jgi:hypothetical protein
MSTIADLLHIERTKERPPDSEGLVLGEDSRTLRDLLNAREELDSDPSTVWRFNPDDPNPWAR